MRWVVVLGYLSVSFMAVGDSVRTQAPSDSRSKVKIIERCPTRENGVQRSPDSDPSATSPKRTVVPYPNPTDKDGARLVQCAFSGALPESESLHPLQSGDSLPSNGIYRITVRPSTGCHIYILTKDANQQVTWLEPDSEETNSKQLRMGVWLDANAETSFPSDKTCYQLDTHPGKETFYIVAAKDPVGDAGDLGRAAETGRWDLETLKSIQVIEFVIDHIAN